MVSVTSMVPSMLMYSRSLLESLLLVYRSTMTVSDDFTETDDPRDLKISIRCTLCRSRVAVTLANYVAKRTWNEDRDLNIMTIDGTVEWMRTVVTQAYISLVDDTMRLLKQ